MKNLILMISLLFLIGCGGSGDGTSSIDNSQLTQKQNSIGYYGKGTIFGDMEISRGWHVYNNNKHTGLLWMFSTDGTAMFGDFNDGELSSWYDFGTSKNGKTVTITDTTPPTVLTYKSSDGNGCMFISVSSEGVLFDNIKICKSD